MRQREGEVLSMGRFGKQLFRQNCVEEQLIMWSSGELLFRQRRVKKTAGSVSSVESGNLEDGFLPRDLAGNLK